jgi:hypothetical protein
VGAENSGLAAGTPQPVSIAFRPSAPWIPEHARDARDRLRKTWSEAAPLTRVGDPTKSSAKETAQAEAKTNLRAYLKMPVPVHAAAP